MHTAPLSLVDVLSSRTGPSVLSLVRLVRKLYRDQISPIQGFVNYSIAKPDREIQSRLLSSEARQSPVRDRSREQRRPSYIVGSNPLRRTGLIGAKPYCVYRSSWRRQVASGRSRQSVQVSELPVPARASSDSDLLRACSAAHESCIASQIDALLAGTHTARSSICS